MRATAREKAEPGGLDGIEGSMRRLRGRDQLNETSEIVSVRKPGKWWNLVVSTVPPHDCSGSVTDF